MCVPAPNQYIITIKFKPTKTQIQLDSIRLDSIYQNEEIRYRSKYIINAIPSGWGGWNDKKDTQIYYGLRGRYAKRKDTAKALKNNKIIILKKTDSILNKYK